MSFQGRTAHLPRLPASPVEIAPVAALVGSMVSLCLGASYARQLFPAVGAAGAVTFRIVIAALILVALRRPWRHPLGRRDALAIAAYGLVLGLLNLMFYMAIRTIPLGLAIGIEFTGPLAVALAASRRARDVAWIGLAAAGLFLLLPLGADAGAALDPVGVAYALGAAVLWAMYILCGKRIGHLDGGQAVALGMSVAALAVVPFGIAGAGVALLDPRLIAAGAAVAILSSAVPYSLEMYALRKLPRHTFGVLLSLEPAIGSLAALVLLGQRLTLVQWLAIACIVAASAGCTLSARRPARGKGAGPRHAGRCDAVGCGPLA